MDFGSGIIFIGFAKTTWVTLPYFYFMRFEILEI